MRESVLLFAITDETVRRKIQTALLPFKVRLRSIGPEDCDRKLGALAGLEEDEQPGDPPSGSPLPASPAKEITEPMLVFIGLSGEKFDRILSALRSTGIPLPNKAVLTPTNCHWTPRELFGELLQERASIAAAREARNLTKPEQSM